ncbi:OLC1v1005053C1 [Oldenlandia corymbosa var. corymbosa]|uniref:OLC1v1005053C1 n=1 Tax=Oldenlandia corymbosa var. corymbosa TaxID=529605 RepID=A0AAV1DG61_OLDCO|nr:OLC1v1005053C1 [Oldenlandia corymbosa var. corymbosa]
MVAIENSNCFYSSHHRDPCKVSSNLYMIMFGIVQIFFAQIPDFDPTWWLSIVAAEMSFTYSMIGLGLRVGRVAESAFGDLSPGNLLTGFDFYNPYWLVDIANLAIVVHLVGAYQVFSQPFLAFVENIAIDWFPESKLYISQEIEIPLYGFKFPYKLNFFRLIWRTIFVIFTTMISMLMPFFNDVVGILGAIGFWPLTVYFPVQMYIVQMKIQKWSRKWICLQILSVACLIISIAADARSVAGVVTDLKTYKPFKTSY